LPSVGYLSNEEVDDDVVVFVDDDERLRGIWEGICLSLKASL